MCVLRIDDPDDLFILADQHCPQHGSQSGRAAGIEQRRNREAWGLSGVLRHGAEDDGHPSDGRRQRPGRFQINAVSRSRATGSVNDLGKAVQMRQLDVTNPGGQRFVGGQRSDDHRALRAESIGIPNRVTDRIDRIAGVM